MLLAAPAPGVPPLGPSGASAHLRGVAQALHAAGHDLRVVAARASDRRGVHGHLPVPVEEAGVPGWPSWLGPWRERQEALAGWRVARVALRGPPPDLVWERWSLFAGVGEPLRRRHGATWLLEVNAPLALERARFEVLRDPAYAARWQARTLRAADRVLAVSPWLARWLVDEVGVPPERVRVVPNGHAPRRGDREATREALGLRGRLVLGFLGSMKPWHGVERVLGLLDRLQGACALIVGADPPAALAAHPRAVCTGQVDEDRAADLVAAMDCGLAPYPADAPPWFCPLKVLAYRAQGTPVVASAVGELASLVGEGGALVDPDDLDAMARACEDLAGARRPPLDRPWSKVVEEALAGL